MIKSLINFQSFFRAKFYYFTCCKKLNEIVHCSENRWQNQGLVNGDQFHPLERIPSSENVDKNIFESTAIKENHPNTEVIPMVDKSLFESAAIKETRPYIEVIPMEPINNAAIVSPVQNSVSSSNITYIPSSLPASQNWTGPHDFNVSFARQEKNTKGVSWTYSSIKDKLYVRKDAPCPINFSAKNMSFNVSIRAMALYTSPEHASEVVHRCVNHSMNELSKEVFEAKHLVRCESQMAYYEIDQTTQHHSVIVPFENPPAGQQFSTYIYKFTCFGSCAGGPNRRPLMLIFSLEREGKVIGRQKLDVKICACPGRDKKTEEKHFGIEVAPEMPLKRKAKEMTSLCDVLDFTKSIYLPPVKKKKSDTGPPYIISITDQRGYEFLKNMKKLFDMCKSVNNLPPNIKALMYANSQKNNQDSD
ncbi:tumor protein p73 [Trichonephila inaurata madagascariensis]|uniref:Tumor protein p73 n=1 Tax=Trichonephila inaurata madagascariensis TaxID=2747483 RepID=A0A8X6X3P0_9ARAC|nr:tumor protein p73 [Trichonephila inaurata madagascariensis]